MYPLLPIVSSIVVGDKKAGKGRAFYLVYGICTRLGIDLYLGRRDCRF